MIMDKTLQLIRNYHLDHYLKILLTENKGNDNPYHNFHHTVTMMRCAYDIAKTEYVDNTHIRLILIAALFHDFNHSGGKFKNDLDNITDAIEAFRHYTQETEYDSYVIEKMIRSTQYPYAPDYEPTLSEKILRDADLLQSSEDNYIQQVLIGLSSEMGVVVSAKNQIKFMKSAKLHTEYAKKIFTDRLPDYEYLAEVMLGQSE